MTVASRSSDAARGRWALAVMFLVNGFFVGSWAPQIPEFVHRLGISEFTLGLMIFGFGLGAVAAMSSAGYLLSRFGSQRVLIWFAWAIIPTLLLVALAPNVAAASAALFCFGGIVGAMDVSMNSNAVAVERKLAKAIMSSSHGFWSLGGFFGGALGGPIIQYFGHLWHAALVTLVAFAGIAVASRHVLADEAHAAAASADAVAFRLPRNPTIYIIGLMALLAMNSEGAVIDWAALYLRQELGANIATAGFAFAAFAGTMAIVRFAGDGIRDRYGAVATFRISSLIAAAGMLAAGLAPWPWLAIIAFGISGLGVANMVPILFSAGGNQPGISSGAGMSVVTTMGYSGILAAPSLIGFVGGEIGFAPVYVAIAVLLAPGFLLAHLTASADLNHETSAGPLPL